MHVELNTERYSLQQALANQGKKSEQDAEHLTEIEGLRKELAKAKRDLSRALKEAAKAEQVDELKEELAREKRGRERAEKNAEKAGEVEELRQELAKEKLEREKAEKNTDMGEQVEDLKKQLAKEKREREESGKQAAKVQTDSEAQKAIVEDKLNQFRTKLKSTKEKLKERRVSYYKHEPWQQRGSLPLPKQEAKTHVREVLRRWIRMPLLARPGMRVHRSEASVLRLLWARNPHSPSRRS